MKLSPWQKNVVYGIRKKESLMLKPTEADKINSGQLRQGVVKVIENPKFSQTCPENILLQTWLPVTVLLKRCVIITNLRRWCKRKESHCARFWNVSALKVIGIIDRDGGLINENGFTLKK
jgi:hypothetical protein